jgi:hypothetical protein
MSAMVSRAPTRFDLVLLVIGLALAAGVGVGWLSTVPLLAAIVAGTAVAGVAMIDALVLHPPGN